MLSLYNEKVGQKWKAIIIPKNNLVCRIIAHIFIFDVFACNYRVCYSWSVLWLISLE